MDKIRPKTEITEEIIMEHAYQTYSLLKDEVRHWQGERGSYWSERLSPAETFPYYPLVDLPENAVLELWQRLNRVVGVFVKDSDLKKNWHEFKAAQPVTDTDMFSRLYIALSGVAQFYREMIAETKKDVLNNGTQDHQIETSGDRTGTACPICGEVIELSVLAPPNGKRYMHCKLCGYEWSAKRVGCIRCGSEQASEQIYLHTEEFPGVEMVVCQVCKQYFKELDLRILSVKDIVWEDLRTLPLNYAAEQWFTEKAKMTGKIL